MINKKSYFKTQLIFSNIKFIKCYNPKRDMKLEDYTKYYAQKLKEHGKGIYEYKKWTTQHGVAEFCMGLYLFTLPIILSYIAPKIKDTNAFEIFKYYVCIGGAYYTLEGISDILFRQRKHHILSSILEKFGVDKFSVPKARDLEKYLG